MLNGDSVLFRGIPYAKPPVGNLRWRPPVLPKPWTSPLDASKFGPVCPQIDSNNKFVGDEDCLTLNVSIPSDYDGSAHLPVLVYIHGGGFTKGSGREADHVSHMWNREGIIFVTLNYRLGALGFFFHPETADELDPQIANFGLLDMVAALTWMRNNIEHFGGDPERVTIQGVSAGAMSVHLLTVSPLGAGLFAGAISHSGYGTWPLPRTKAAKPLPGAVTAETIATGIIEQITGTTRPHGAENLRNIPAELLVRAVQGFHLPIVDDSSLPDEPAVLFSAGKQNRANIILGATSYEGSAMQYSGFNNRDILSMFPGSLADIRRLYQEDFQINDDQAVSRLFGDARYLLSAYYQGLMVGRQNRPIYRYYFDYLPEILLNQWPGAPHGAAIWAMYGSVIPGYVKKFLGPGTPFHGEKTPMLVKSFWTNFIKTGNPNGASLPQWPSVGVTGENWFVFGKRARAERVILQDKLELLERWYRERITKLEGSEKPR